MYNFKSYEKHQEFIETNNNDSYIKELFSEESPIFEYSEVFFKNLSPLIYREDTWLTVGDFTGIDAAFIKRKGAKSTATDLSTKVLKKEIFEKGLIDDFDEQNVENLTYSNNSFDFVCCKEAYHHFPRPTIGFYEMLRVAKKGVVLIEPNDINISFPFVVILRNLLDRIDTNLLRKFWKNQYSYEVVGNFVYKVSFREFEKMAVALDLPCMAYRGFNNPMSVRWATLPKKRLVRGLFNFLCKISLIPYMHLSIVVFKETITPEVRQNLKKTGYKIFDLPKNPYN